MSQPLMPPAEDTFEGLWAFNAAMLARHKGHRVFSFFSDGTLENARRRETFLGCIQALSRHFQTILYARQAHCADERYSAIFLRHLQEELGHDETLRRSRGGAPEVWDPVLEGTMAWFVSRMTILDNIEKLAVVHLVLEASGAHMGAVSREPMRRFASAEYFSLHDELDNSHVTVALEPLRCQSPDTLRRVRVVVEQAWRMLDAHADRVAQLVVADGAEPLAPGGSQ